MDTVTLTPRQAEYADAALEVLSRDGLGGVSFRSVAGQAERSLGAVQKAFPTKTDLLNAMFARLRDSAVPLPASEPGRPTLVAWLTELFLLMQPLDDERRAAYARSSAFTDHALRDATVAQAITAGDREIRARLESLVRRAQAEGEVPESVDPTHAIWAYLALAQGTAAQLLLDPGEADGLTERARTAISALLG